MLALMACSGGQGEPADDRDKPILCGGVDPAVVAIPAGSFTMGSLAVYREEGPPRTTRIDRFWIDRTEVTNAQFAQFVAATGYQTVAERPVDPSLFDNAAGNIPADLLKPGSAVFQPGADNGQAGSWRYLPGAYWRKPEGAAGTPSEADHPVVHLAYEDMAAYARWKGGRLPTEAEWEYAATANAPESVDQPGPRQANSWQGAFPFQDRGDDGYRGTAPVGCYEPNDFGLYDMVGNVWEVTADHYRSGHAPYANDNPTGPDIIDTTGTAERVMKGGSYLCAPNYCRRYRPEARHARDPGLGASNVGFRVAYDAPPSPD